MILASYNYYESKSVVDSSRKMQKYPQNLMWKLLDKLCNTECNTMRHAASNTRFVDNVGWSHISFPFNHIGFTQGTKAKNQGL